jgi:HupE / UreJ protein
MNRITPSPTWTRLSARTSSGLLCTALFFAPSAFAHKPSDSYLTLTAQGTEVSVRWDVALRDLDPELGLDVNDDGLLSWGEVRTRARDIAAFVMPQLNLSAKRGPCTTEPDPIPTASSPAKLDPATELPTAPTIAAGPGVELSLATHSDGAYAVLQYRQQCGAIAEILAVDYHLFATTDPTHRGIVRVAGIASGSQVATVGSLAVLGPGASHHVFQLTGSSRLATLRAFVVEGIWHIWLGFDHVLFLLTLLLPSVLLARTPQTSGRSGFTVTTLDVLKIVTAFTVAHSLTLTLAVLDWVSLPSRLVESGIALTVLLGALNNLRPVLRERRWIAAFAFGLIHGFGFAGALKALKLPAGDLALSLFGFNVGVEIGQLAIVAAFVPLAYRLRNTVFYRVGVVRGGSIVIALIAAAWFIERAWDVKLLTP